MEPPNPAIPPYNSENAICDKILARIFGGRDAIAAGNNYEPEGMPGYPTAQHRYRGTLNGIPGHLSNQMHLYGSSDGRQTTGVYVPGGYDAVYPNPRANPGDRGGSFVFYYSNLGKFFENVSLVVTHVANYNIRNEGGRVRIGDIGGPGGTSAAYNPNEPYIHSHFSLLRGQVDRSGRTSLASMPKLTFPEVFCR